MKVNAQRLAEIRARAAAAFRPPWTHGLFTVECEPGDPRCPEGDPDECEGEREALRLDAPDEDPEGGQVVCDVYGLETFAGPNAAFIANARADVPDLVEDLEEARREQQLAMEGAKKSAVEFLRADAGFLIACGELCRLEWSGRMQGDSACPRCWALWKMDAKHAPDCSLARALGRLPEGLVRAKAQHEEVIGDIRITAESPDGELWVVSSTRVSTGETMAVTSLPAGSPRLLDRAFAAGQEFERLRASALADGDRHHAPSTPFNPEAFRAQLEIAWGEALAKIADHAGDDFNSAQDRRYRDEWTEAAGFTECQRIARKALGQCPSCGLKDGHEPWCRPEDR